MKGVAVNEVLKFSKNSKAQVVKNKINSKIRETKKSLPLSNKKTTWFLVVIKKWEGIKSVKVWKLNANNSRISPKKKMNNHTPKRT